MEKIRPSALGLSLALLAALSMLVLSLLALAGWYTGAYEMMAQAHMWYDLTLTGIITGMIEAAILSYIAGIIIAWSYNRLA